MSRHVKLFVLHSGSGYPHSSWRSLETTPWLIDWRWWLPRQRGYLEGWRSAHAHPLVAVESDSWCADPTALWTGEGFGWGWLGGCSLFLPPASFFVVFIPVCLEHTTDISDWWPPSLSVWGPLLPWFLVDSRLCGRLFSWSLQCFPVAARSRFPTWSSLKKSALGIRISCLHARWPAQHIWHWNETVRRLDRSLAHYLFSSVQFSPFTDWVIVGTWRTIR